MKIKKNLSDADMFNGYQEEKSFETEYGPADDSKSAPVARDNKGQGKELFLSGEALEKLNKYLLELSMEWFKNGNGEAEWKVLKEKDQIVIKAVQAKRRAVK